MTDNFLSGSHVADTTPGADPLGLGGKTGYAEIDDAGARTGVPAAPETTPHPAPPAPDAVPPANEQPAGEQKAPADEPPAASKYDDLDDYIQSKFGVSLGEALEAVQSLNEYRQQQVIQEQQRTLQGEWGMDYDANMKIVMDAFNKLPDNQKAAYDNVDGARRLYAEYLYRNPKPTAPNTYRLPQRTAADIQTDRPYDFKQSDLLAMPRDEYERRQDEITLAFARGRVLPDVQFNR